MTNPFASGALLSSAGQNSIFTDFLSQPWTQRQSQGAGGTVSGAFATPATPCSVTVTSNGAFALVKISALLSMSTAAIGRGSVAITGDTSLTAANAVSNFEFYIQTALVSGTTPSRFTVVDVIPITPGTNTYTMQYFTASGTLTITSQSILVFAP